MCVCVEGGGGSWILVVSPQLVKTKSPIFSWVGGWRGILDFVPESKTGKNPKSLILFFLWAEGGPGFGQVQTGKKVPSIFPGGQNPGPPTKNKMWGFLVVVPRFV